MDIYYIENNFNKKHSDMNINDKEKERRKKISITLKDYFSSPRGEKHREKLREQQTIKMKNLYNKNKDIKL